MKKDPIIFLEHIADCIENIQVFMEGVSQERFNHNIEKQSAVFRQIEVIGEAVKNLPEDIRGQYPRVPWKDIVGMRDKLLHHYFGVNLPLVWSVIKEDLPPLKENIANIIRDLKEKGVGEKD